MKMEEYLSNPAVSASGLHMLMQNAKKYRLWRDGKINEPSREKDIGTVTHACVLEPERCREVFEVNDDIKPSIVELAEMDISDIIVVDVHNKNCKEFQSAKKENPSKKVILGDEFDALNAYLKIKHKVILSSGEFEVVKSLTGKLLALDNFKDMLAKGEKEQSYFGKIDDIDVKCRPDLIVKLEGKTESGLTPVLIFDVKTMFSEISHDGFAKASGENCYYLSEVLCRNIMMQNGFEVVDYTYAGVSKVEWSGAEYFRHDQIALMEGEKLLRAAIKKFEHCQKNNLWLEKQFDFYSLSYQILTTVTLPNYIFYRFPIPEGY